MDLILPVRVRACAEGGDRTGGLWVSGDEPVRASNGRNGEASQRYFAGRRVGRSDVRASTLWAKHQIEPPARSAEIECADIDSGYFGAWRSHAEKMAVIQTR